MRLGIDIDDTITYTWESFIPYYSKMYNIPINVLEKSQPYYFSIKDKISIDEYYQMMVPLCDKIIPRVKLKDNVKEVINKLYDEGNQIIFITARGKDFTDAYKTTIDYLNKEEIKYNKVIINSKDKDKICQSELIDLFIDDSYKHIKSVSNLGIDTIMFGTNYNKDIHDTTRIDNWLDIYKYIKSKGE